MIGGMTQPCNTQVHLQFMMTGRLLANDMVVLLLCHIATTTDLRLQNSIRA
jgi:hypothetical protein